MEEEPGDASRRLRVLQREGIRRAEVSNRGTTEQSVLGAVHGPVMMTIERIHDGAVLRGNAHQGDAGFDLVVPYGPDESIVIDTIQPGETKKVGIGIRIALPPATVGLVCPRSGLAAKRGITVLNAPGIVDEGYRGELAVLLHNTSDRAFDFRSGDRVAQLVITPYITPVYVEGQVADDTERGAGGFGSTGV